MVNDFTEIPPCIPLPLLPPLNVTEELGAIMPPFIKRVDPPDIVIAAESLGS
jgi:hypothetical protein